MLAQKTEVGPALAADSRVEFQTYLLEDRSAQLSLVEIRPFLNSATAQLVERGTTNFGYTDSAILYKWSFRNSTPDPVPFVFVVGDVLLEDFQLFAEHSGKVFTLPRIGLAQQRARAFEFRKLSYQLELPAETLVTYYARAAGHTPLVFDFSVYSLDSQNENYVGTLSLLLLYLGTIFAIVAYNLFLFFTTRDTSFVYYGAAMLSLAGVICSLNGWVVLTILEYPWLVQHHIVILFFLASLFNLAFASRFFKSREGFPRLHTVLTNLMIFDAVALVISCFVSGNKIYMLGSGLLVVTMMVVVSIAIASVRKGNRAGSLYLFSWFALLPSISIALVTDLGLFDFQFNDDLVLKVAHAAEALLMSSALAFRIRMLRSEKLESDKQVLRSEAKSEAKSRYFEEMSLELRAPVDGVIGMADLLSGTNLDEHQRQYVNAIHRSSQGLINIVDDISDMSEIDTGKLEIETNDFQLDILLNDVGIMLAPLTNKRHLELITSIKPNTPMMLTGDPVRLQQVITDLISSVAQVIEEGQVIVRASQFSATDVYSEIRLKSVIPVLVLMKIFNTSCLNPSNQMGTAHPAGLLESGSV